MSLKDYHRKRDFKKTTEPRGRTARTPTGDRFVVQKHDASRLHYDFRLELDGVLKSWAVPKGPSLDPADKRLAVHVEDHPVDYGDFEGVIPEGYGAGTVLLWDRGRWHPRDKDPRKAYREGHLKFDLEGEKLRGGWMLVRMNGERGDDGRNWLLVKEQDAAARRGKAGRITDHEPASVETGRDINQVAAAKDRQWRSNREAADPDRKQKELRKQTTGRAADAAPRTKKNEPPDPARVKGARRGPLPADPRPQLTTLVAQPPRGDGWLHEIKYDGYRILARLEHGRARLLSRNGKDWTARFEAIATALRELEVDDALLDGEVVVLDEKGVSSFQQLQNFTRQGKQAELCYYVFDLLHLNGYDLRRAGQLERKELVRRLLDRAGRKGRVRFSDHVRGGGDEVLDNACRLGLEGIISKKADAPYAERRTRSWVKLKCGRRQEFVIAGYTDPGGSRAGFGALVLGYYDEGGRLIYCGRVGTGFSDRMLKRMHEDLRRRERRQSP
ncbi:MAG TPA: non-homologous end-joining DNA ligase, partial [Candidatus Sumerlaeota bacterium]|nr:non-homologous end-joining DNA ligase [Candidatus Sumerlaeota bacterium]